MKLLEYLEKHKKKRKDFKKSEDYLFYSKNKGLVPKSFSNLTGRFIDDFSIFRANIIIHGVINKALMEAEVKNLVKYTESHQILTHDDFVNTLKSRLENEPYLDEKEGRIYIPFFPKSINLLYLNEPERLNEYPYTDLFKSYSSLLIDPFDTYGNELYNTKFTNLVKVESKNNVQAYFHYDTLTIYLINDQGRLDSKIVLFDRYLKKINSDNILERIKPVVDSYYDNNVQNFIKNMEINGFISSRMLFKLNHKFANRL